MRIRLKGLDIARKDSRSSAGGWAHCPRASMWSVGEGRATVSRACCVSSTRTRCAVPIYPQQSPVLVAWTWRTRTYPPRTRARRRGRGGRRDRRRVRDTRRLRSVAAEPGTRPSRSPVVADQSPRAPAHRQGHGARPARRGSTALRTLSRPANGGPKHARTHTDTTPDTTERSRSGRHSTDVEEQQQPETRDEKNIWFGVYATRPAMAPGRTSRRRHRLRRRASRD